MARVVDTSGNWPVGVKGPDTPKQAQEQAQVALVGGGVELAVVAASAQIDGTYPSIPVSIDPFNNLVALDPGTILRDGAVGPDGVLRSLASTLDAAQIAVPYADPARTWQWSTGGSVINTTTPSVMKAGQATRRQQLVALQFINTNATATELQVLDGATIVWDGYAGASMTQMVTINFEIPLLSSIGNALSLKTVTTSASVYASAQGFTSQ